MKHKEVFDCYYSIQSEEMREEIEGYKPLSETITLPPGTDRNSAIMITFKDGSWLRAYERTDNNSIEWY